MSDTELDGCTAFIGLGLAFIAAKEKHPVLLSIYVIVCLIFLFGNN